jgi:hypothetical protein
VLGAGWGLLISSGAGFFTLIIGAGIGYCVGESVSVVTNRKVGTLLQVIAGGGCVLAYFARNVVAADGILLSDDLFGLIAVVIAIAVAAGRLRF